MSIVAHYLPCQHNILKDAVRCCGYTSVALALETERANTERGMSNMSGEPGEYCDRGMARANPGFGVANPGARTTSEGDRGLKAKVDPTVVMGTKGLG